MLTAAIQRQGWSQTAAVANDTFAVLRAGLTPADAEPAWGIAVTCGAGINCVGVGPDGATTRFLAFGTLSGDWGGGLGLGHHSRVARDPGRRRPRRADRAASGRRPRSSGWPSMHDVAVAFHLGQLGEDDLIRLPAVLFAAAEAGDAVALSLVERQAEEVCTMAVTAISRLDLDADQDGRQIPVVLGGGVLEARNPLLTGAITRRLAELRPDRRRPRGRHPPVTGAALLGLDYLNARRPRPPASAPTTTRRSRAADSRAQRG